jgi:mRNA interferase MazF
LFVAGPRSTGRCHHRNVKSVESRAGVVVVVPTTTTRRRPPSHVEIEPNGSGLDAVSYAKCEEVKSVSEQRLIGRLGAVNDAVTFQIDRALRFLLDL